MAANGLVQQNIEITVMFDVTAYIMEFALWIDNGFIIIIVDTTDLDCFNWSITLLNINDEHLLRVYGLLQHVYIYILTGPAD